ASGEILEMPVQPGHEVQKGQLLAKIDPRIPRNNLTQAQANVDVAQAQLENATAQLKRSETLYQSKSITEADEETAKLAYTSAKAALVTAQANLQTAKDAMEDTQVQVHSGAREVVLAVPNAALRTPRGVGSAATVLGLDSQAVQRQIASAQTDSGAPTGGDTAVGDGGKLHAAEPRKRGGTASRS